VASTAGLTTASTARLTPQRSRSSAATSGTAGVGLRTVAIGCAVLAFVVRLARAGGIPGLWAYGGYDDGVYFAAADAFVHGRVPYRDFLLLHPPGVVLALAPFAELTHWTSDAHALVVARLAYMALGALNTALVVVVASTWGRRSALTAGVLYALLPMAVVTEYLTMLEPLGTTALLGAVLLARRAGRAGASGWWSFAVGAAVGVAPVTKIWGVVTVAVVLAWHALRLGPRAGLRALAGAAATGIAVLGPFALLAGRSLWRDVVTDQLKRPSAPVTLGSRLQGITGTGYSTLPLSTHGVLTWVVVLALVACAVVVWRARTGRLWVVLLAAQSLVLLSAPTFYAHYPALAAPSLVLLVAAAVGTVQAARLQSIAAVTACVGLVVATGPMHFVTATPFPASEVRAVLPQSGCVRSDSPGALALLNVLSRDLERGCTVQIDLSGITYDRPVVVASRAEPRVRNALYQEAAADYLSTGSSAVLVRGPGDGFDAATVREMDLGREFLRFPDNTRVLLDALPGRTPPKA
jgi:alpha-1,2-mannosyltransferase